MHGAPWAVALLGLLAACGEPAGPAPEHLVRELMAVWESGEAARLADLMSPEVTYEDVPNGVSHQGIDASMGYITHVHTWASEVDISIHRTFGDETDAMAEWTMTAIQSGPIPGRVPVATGRPITLEGATVVHVEDGRITRAADYLDVLGFVLQLGSEVTLPGDVVIGSPE